MTKINISIPNPYHENWEGMTNVEKGKFCNSCQKKVFDFTNASDREIVKAFEQNNQLCGRFLNTQLNRDLIKPKERKSLWFAATIVSLLGIGTNETTAQEPVKTEQTPEHSIVGKIAYVKPKEIEISGVVLDENKLPLPRVNVIVKGKNISTQTDFDGKYKIKAEIGDVLVYTFIGLETKELEISNNCINTTLHTELKNETVYVTVGAIVTKRTFLGRIFHSIGNLIR